MATVRTRFDCSHTTMVDVKLDEDIEVPEEVRGLGKCAECQQHDNLWAISGFQVMDDGRRVLDSMFLMPVE